MGPNKRDHDSQSDSQGYSPLQNTSVQASKASIKPYATIFFKYQDGEGNITERTVDVITGKKGEMFKAYCHLRQDERSFYFSRIYDFEVIDVNSGESLTPMEWRYKLQGTKVARKELERERNVMKQRI